MSIEIKAYASIATNTDSILRPDMRLLLRSGGQILSGHSNSLLSASVDPRCNKVVVKGEERLLDQLEINLQEIIRQIEGKAKFVKPWVRRELDSIEMLTGIMALLVGREAVGLMGPIADGQLVDTRNVYLKALALEDAGLLRWYQRDAVIAGLRSWAGRAIIQAPTGAGKTRVAVGLMALGGGDWVYLAPNEELAVQTQREVDVLYGQMKGAGKVTCLSYGTLTSAKCEGVTGAVCDEVHRIGCSTMARALAQLSCQFRIGLSATPLMRQDGRNSIVVGIIGPVVYTIDIKRLEADGYIAQGIVQQILV